MSSSPEKDEIPAKGQPPAMASSPIHAEASAVYVNAQPMPGPPPPAAGYPQYYAQQGGAGPPPAALGGVSIQQPDQQKVYGSDPTIRLVGNAIPVIYKAKLATSCLDRCDSSRPRRYYWVLENAIERNYPSACFCIPPNCLCPGSDWVWKTYYDRGVFDRQSLGFCSGYLNGPGTFHVGPVRYQCCWIPCTFCHDCCTCMCCFTCSCIPCCPSTNMEYIGYVPATNYCWCYSTRATCWDNCCGICGIMEGDPKPQFLFTVASHLKQGEAAKVHAALVHARGEWSRKTGRGL